MKIPSRCSYWRLKSTTIRFGSLPAVMGIVNVTPDSFSDGGNYLNPQRAVAHALQLVDQGADILDVGGESTRPGSHPVSVEEELDRVMPVILELVQATEVPVSIDTSKSAVARQALAAGAQIVNDVTGLLGDGQMVEIAQQYQAGVCAMHMLGTPQTMQEAPNYGDVVLEIFDYLKARRDSLIEQGIDADRICLDPGIGFGKTHQHNLHLLAAAEQFLDLACPILIGHSRKGFLARLFGQEIEHRDRGTVAVSLLLAQKGIHILRVHDVAATVNGLRLLAAIRESEPELEPE